MSASLRTSCEGQTAKAETAAAAAAAAAHEFARSRLCVLVAALSVRYACGRLLQAAATATKNTIEGC